MTNEAYYDNEEQRNSAKERRQGKKRKARWDSAKGFKKVKKEETKVEQAMLGVQVQRSIHKYTRESLETTLDSQDLKGLGVRKLHSKGVMGKNNDLAEERNTRAKKKAARQRNPPPTTDDFHEKGAEMTVSNDSTWKTPEEERKLARLKQLKTKTFWVKQNKEVLFDVYKKVFPGIREPEKPTKTSVVDVIKEYCDREDADDMINVDEAEDLESNGNTNARAKRDATRLFCEISGHTEVDQHYLDYCSW